MADFLMDEIEQEIIKAIEIKAYKKAEKNGWDEKKVAKYIKKKLEKVTIKSSGKPETVVIVELNIPNDENITQEITKGIDKEEIKPVEPPPKEKPIIKEEPIIKEKLEPEVKEPTPINEIAELYKSIEEVKPFMPFIPILKFFSQPNFKIESQVEFWQSYMDLVNLYPKMLQKYWTEEFEKKKNSDGNKPL